MENQQPSVPQPPAIYMALANINREIPAVAKLQRNVQQGYNFRGVDDVVNAVKPLFAAHGVFILCEILSKDFSRFTTDRGKECVSVVVHCRYHFVASDGSEVLSDAIGEGLDYGGDKAAAKAQSMAYKYALLAVCQIPTAMLDHAADPRESAPVRDDRPIVAPRSEREPTNGVSPKEIFGLKKDWKIRRAKAGLPQGDKDWQIWCRVILQDRAFDALKTSCWAAGLFNRVKQTIADGKIETEVRQPDYLEPMEGGQS